MKGFLRLVLFASFFSLGFGLVFAESFLVPAERTGEVVYVPFPVSISLDGAVDDWKGVPLVVVDRGPAKKDKDPEVLRFSLAADANKLYILLLSKDVNLVSGQHGGDWWNEDSLEFYVNLGANLGITAYNKDSGQFNIKPIDIGKKDPAALTITGTNAEGFGVRGLAFKTEEGWGFEGSISLEGRVVPEHGKEIGFQAQLNGASTKDRDLKLIWSLADKGDTSWQNPRVFGRAIFFSPGRADIPEPSALKAIAQVKAGPTEALSINQNGYLPDGPKIAILAKESPVSLPWYLFDAVSSNQVASGKTLPAIVDKVSGDTVHRADFSNFKKQGTYRIVIGGVSSGNFRIGKDVYTAMEKDALAYFYRSRSGIALTPELAGEQWARGAGHLSDAQITAYEGKDAQGKSWTTWPYLIDGSGGWYDAGDYGKYVVNGGISVWTLVNAYERKPSAFKDAALSVPERGNKVPDLLDEARWNQDFMLRMQIPEGQKLSGMVFHKLHDRTWSGVPAPLPEKMDNNNSHKGEDWGRFVYQPTTAATLNLAATAAQAARVWKKFDPAWSAKNLSAAERAWTAAQENPAVLAGNVPGNGGGNYDDANVSDDFYWAAAELFITTGKKEYLDFILASPYFANFPGTDPKAASAMSWGDTAALGTLSLALVPNKLSAAQKSSLRAQILAAADRYLAIQKAEGYLAPIDAAGYVWGSNSLVLNNAIVMALAYDFSKKKDYLAGVVNSMNYLLGVNPLRKSYVTGYGIDTVMHPHHRIWANKPEAGSPPPPPGIVAGGPNASLQDPAMTAANLGDLAIAKRYLDKIDSYATNEITINWNAPFAWICGFLDQNLGK